MATEEPRYRLSFLFDRDQIDRASLRADAKLVLADKLASVTLRASTDLRTQHPLLTITGPLEDVDACHELIAKNLIQPRQLKFMRVVDEAGDEVRRRAYAVVSRIEQRLRRFVNDATTMAVGFDWWSGLGLGEGMMGADSTEGDSGSDSGLPLHPLERMTFTQLVSLIAAPIPNWGSQRLISAGDLDELLAGCQTLDELQAALTEKLREETVWDRVFSRQFADPADWERAKSALKWVIRQRNAVMHHRPMRLGALRGLEQKEREIIGALGGAKRSLPAEQLRDVQQALAALQDLVAQSMQKIIADALAPLQASASAALDAYMSQMARVAMPLGWLDTYLGDWKASLSPQVSIEPAIHWPGLLPSTMEQPSGSGQEPSSRVDEGTETEKARLPDTSSREAGATDTANEGSAAGGEPASPATEGDEDASVPQRGSGGDDD